MSRTLLAGVVAVAVMVGCGPTGGPDGGTQGGGAGGGGGSGGGGGGALGGGGGSTDAGFDGGIDAGPGCRDNSPCTSGLCAATGDCVNCQGDRECGEGKVCGSATCQPSCAGAGQCTGGFVCNAGTTCVNPARDPAHCGDAGVACAADTFCAGAACVPTTFASLCALPIATVMLDGQPADDTAGQAIGAALVAACAPGVASRTAGQADAGVVSVRDGKPLALGELIVTGGGSFRQQAVRWFETTNTAPVRDSSTATQAIYSRRDGGVISSVPLSTLSASRDRLLVQIARAPHGPVVLMAYGGYAEGTRAAATYFVDTVLPARATATTSWVVLDWLDQNLDGVAQASEFTVIDSGR